MGEQDNAGLQGEHAGSLAIVDRVVSLAGYAYGLRQPCLQFRLRVEGPFSESRLDVADEWIRETFAGVGNPPPAGSGDPVVEHFLDWTRRMLESHHQPVIDLPKMRASESGGWQIWHPCLSFEACKAAVGISLELLNASLAAGAVEAERVRHAADAARKLYGPALNHGRLYGFNPLHFAQAAHALGIPWQRFSGRVLQVGIGAASRLLESSMTDQTSTISTMFARDKMRGAEIMRNGGLPVADHELVSTADKAQETAGRLGYPVVVKPADSDGGQGVAAYLHSAGSVARAFARALEFSNRIMVEKHVDGNDYRFHIVGETIIGVLERSPGSVTGDGRRSVRELVEDQNNERRTATDDRRHLHPIEPDEEAETILADTGKSWDTVLPAGTKLRLRGAASVSRGGVPREVDLAEIHPDNVALAVRAVRLLRLDIAGVDLILPEIGTSWLQTGANICEVNASPSMFTNFHEPTLRLIMKGGDGRVPTVVVIGSSSGEQLSSLIHARLCEHGLAAGLVGADGPFLGSKRPFAEPSGSYTASVALTRDPALEALVISVADREIPRHGWPIDQCDALVFVRGSGSDSPPLAAHEFPLLVGMAADLMPRTVFVDAGDPACSSAGRRWKGAQLRTIGEVRANEPPLEELAAAIVDQLLKGQAEPTS